MRSSRREIAELKLRWMRMMDSDDFERCIHTKKDTHNGKSIVGGEFCEYYCFECLIYYRSSMLCASLSPKHNASITNRNAASTPFPLLFPPLPFIPLRLETCASYVPSSQAHLSYKHSAYPHFHTWISHHLYTPYHSPPLPLTCHCSRLNLRGHSRRNTPVHIPAPYTQTPKPHRKSRRILYLW